MRLTSTMSLVERDTRVYFPDHPIEEKAEYRFWVDDGYYVVLTIAYHVVGQTCNYYVPIVNFGYKVSIEHHDIKNANFRMISDLDPENGASTKRHFPDPINRALVRKFVMKSLERYILRKNPPVIVRGPITSYKRSLDRYHEISVLLNSMGYAEKIARIDQMPDGLSTLKNKVLEPEDEMWMYIRDERLWEELEGWKANQ